MRDLKRDLKNAASPADSKGPKGPKLPKLLKLPKFELPQMELGTGKTRVLRLPLAFGLRLILEMRFTTLLFIGFLIYLFGALVANEWIYLMASGFAVAAILGAIVPMLLLLDLTVDYSFPEEILSEEGASVIIRVRRKYMLGPISKLLPANWLRLTVDVARRGKDGTTYEKVLPPDPVLIESLGDEKWFEFPTPLLKRGIYLLKGVELSTCFPLGIVWWARRMSVRSKTKENISITVYPRHYPISGNFLSHLKGVASTMGLATSGSAVTHQSTSFRSVREFRSGDSLRHIHWPSTARYGDLLVKEFDQEMIPVFDLLLNLRAPWKTPEQFELAVVSTMSLCHLGFNQGQIPELILNPGLDSKELEPLMFDLPKNINPGLHLYSEILARVEPMSMSARRTEDEEDTSGLDYIAVAEREVITLFPTHDQVVKYSPDHGGDLICRPIDLGIVSSNWDYDPTEAEDESLVARAVSFATMRKPARKQEEMKRLLGPTEGQVIGRIEWEKDLEAL